MRRVIGAIAAVILIASLLIGWRFDNDLAKARVRAAHGSVLVQTRCGPIEYQEAGTGAPLLVVHGAGGGHDQGMALAGSLAQQGVRVIAMSRFGYLRTPMPPDASPAAQADAHACLLDALGIRQARVLGASAGAPSAMQLAIRHPERVSALILMVPLAYKPVAVADSAPAPSALAGKVLDALVGSDFLFWAMRHMAPDQLIRRVLGTPPELVAAASPAEQQRVNAMLDIILPVSDRAAGLRNESKIGRNLQPYPLEAIRAPTLIISARDDGYGTYASAQYTASRIAGARFIGYDQGGHLLVGHDEETQQQILNWQRLYNPVP
jgi:pimeloyl-ACP methyl ester carboxylesterase